jgi:hypothetical protein
MVAPASRLLAAFSASLLAFGSFMHAIAFHRTLTAVAKSDLTPFFGNSLKLLWLGDCCMMAVLSALFVLIAVRPSVATKPALIMLSLIPASTGILIYIFLGFFFAGHLLVAAGAGAFVAGWLLPSLES